MPSFPRALPPRRSIAEWAVLCVASAALAGLLKAAGLPAALLLGAMLAAIACGLAGFKVRVPRPGFQGAQAIIGLLIAHSVTGSLVRTVLDDGPIMLAVVVVTVAASALVGWLLTRLKVLPGATAAWGSSPGGAAAMTAMSEAYGADPRYVAFMQYVRVVCVAITATFVARAVAGPGGMPASSAPAVDQGLMAALLPLATTLVVGVVGAWLGRRLRIPAGALLGPMFLGAALHASGVAEFALPWWLLALAYAGIGWFVGLRFNRGTLGTVARALPTIVVSTMALIALCGLWAWGLTHILPIDVLTAYLATSPGGIDTVAIIALGTGADVSFVLAAQVLRLFVVLLTGPAIARWIAKAA